MTVQYIFERAMRLLPEVGETEVVHAVNKTLKEFCSRTEILLGSGNLTKVTGQTTYDLSTFASDFYLLKNIEFIDSDSNFVSPGYAPIYKTNGVSITFYDAGGAAMSDMPDYTVKIYYSKIPSALTITSSLPTLEEFSLYIESGVYRELYSSIPITITDRNGNSYKRIDWEAVNFHSQKFEVGIKEGLRYKNMNRNNSIKNIIQYEY